MTLAASIITYLFLLKEYYFQIKITNEQPKYFTLASIVKTQIWMWQSHKNSKRNPIKDWWSMPPNGWTVILHS